uniref:CHAT domain-containing protein n=1 Tax=Calothrix sp. 336/3 TaxID=1337936 RepID=UPI001EDEA9CE|nr:CHAT domain-containing protein [Calothrix sp. 336/3]
MGNGFPAFKGFHYIPYDSKKKDSDSASDPPVTKNSPKDDLKLLLKAAREKETVAKYLSIHHPEKAKFHYHQIIACLDTIQEGQDIFTRRSLINSYSDVYQRIVAICIETQDFSNASLYASYSKNRYLVERLLLKDANSTSIVLAKPYNSSKNLATAKPNNKIEQAYLQEKKALQLYTYQISSQANQQLLAESQKKWLQAKKDLENLYIKASEIEPELKKQTKAYPIDFAEVKSLLTLDTAILEFFFTETVLVLILILPTEDKPIISEKLYVKLQEVYLENIAKNWILELTGKNQVKSNHESNENIDNLALKINEISKCFNFNYLLSFLNTSIQHLIIIPHNYIHLFPVHALWINDNERLIERFSVSYFPSIHVWNICKKLQRKRKLLLTVENPTQDKDLIFAKAEVASITQRQGFTESKLLSGQQASKAEILSCATHHNCFHFSGHAEYNFENPFDSYLMLSSDSDIENLTLNTILADMHMPKADLVTLSACCTGVVDAFQATDEYLGLPTGFLLAGAKAVVSSLWKVNSIATAFLLDEFYRQLEEVENKTVALQQAQNWLRRCSADDLRERANTWNLAKLEPKEQFRLERALKRLEDIPFENPYYWAAFILTGC